ncbi:hypothetical protein EMIHUDRAFT_231175 [Emiliania huxleyi CCMP1516]|uniref:Secreted protein n=2 Tax=Emiliania huxleyi TaxID=2903 RepID=A0A0D3K850_EMIH1|nr:hypothetical protein EMIHUDRAFT_231175 [Emiliania huxleyi CCMP1516]EOD31935.1 hypothetical protein EMIHUDRAFT_231175 [Emiliania huxleyi CCMP1516]|eukprot:XP_005784364.1 hypothetical protein EMIHUDRAFT_231175 [Emiliania huxleyi CCMP1516]
MSVLFFLLLLYALYIASIPFRVSTSLKPAQQLNRSLSRRSIISLTHFARCRLSPLPPAWAAVASLADRASFHPAKSFLSHSMQAPLSKCAIVALGGFSSSSDLRSAPRRCLYCAIRGRISTCDLEH